MPKLDLRCKPIGELPLFTNSVYCQEYSKMILTGPNIGTSTLQIEMARPPVSAPNELDFQAYPGDTDRTRGLFLAEVHESELELG